MRKIQTTEVRSRWFELLRKVEAGKTIAITRHGKAIAHLIPVEAQDRTQRKKSVDGFRRRRAQWPKVEVSLEEILAWRHEGHRF